MIGFGQQVQAFISGNDSICDNDNLDAQVKVSFVGSSPFNFIYAINGINQPNISTSYLHL